MIRLLASKLRKQTEDRSLPPEIRKLIVDLRVELPIISLREISDICRIFFKRKPLHYTIQLVLATVPPPTFKTKRYQPWEMIPDLAERRLAVLFLP